MLWNIRFGSWNHGRSNMVPSNELRNNLTLEEKTTARWLSKFSKKIVYLIFSFTCALVVKNPLASKYLINFSYSSYCETGIWLFQNLYQTHSEPNNQTLREVWSVFKTNSGSSKTKEDEGEVFWPKTESHGWVAHVIEDLRDSPRRHWRKFLPLPYYLKTCFQKRKILGQ